MASRRSAFRWGPGVQFASHQQQTDRISLVPLQSVVEEWGELRHSVTGVRSRGFCLPTLVVRGGGEAATHDTRCRRTYPFSHAGSA